MEPLVVTTVIDAPGEQVWNLITDLPKMGEWSPECSSVRWSQGASGPALGARFIGHNQIGWRRWSTTGKIVTYDPGSEFGWDVTFGPFGIAYWGYRISEHDSKTSCTLAETFVDHRSTLFASFGRVIRGVTDVESHNRSGMEVTLSRIKAEAEASSGRPQKAV